MHGAVGPIVFDIEATSQDLVVGGLAKVNAPPDPSSQISASFLYYINEEKCALRWLFLF